MSDRAFIPGQTLSRLLYEQAVRPIMESSFPSLVYSAALLGDGSDVLGFDTEQSTDHGWGPRLLLFVGRSDHDQFGAAIAETLAHSLPESVAGYPVDMAWEGHPKAPPARQEGLRHRVEIHEPASFFRNQLGQDVTGYLSAVDWLLMPQQGLRSVTAGAVFHDGLGTLSQLREKLTYYPHDVWLYLMAAQWRRVAQEEAFMGRCAQVGDDLGSRLVAARLVRDVMGLAFLMERTYAPYIKWFGTAFDRLTLAAELGPALAAVLAAGNWTEREATMIDSWRVVAARHNALGLTELLPVEAEPFYERPFRVIHAERFELALLAAIEDPAVRALPPYLGGVDQFVDSTDLLSAPGRLQALRPLFQAHEKSS